MKDFDFEGETYQLTDKGRKYVIMTYKRYLAGDKIEDIASDLGLSVEELNTLYLIGEILGVLDES